MHATPGIDIPLAAVNGSRGDFKALKTRGNSAGKLDSNGLWANLGPDNAVYPLNPFRNRTVYVPNEYVAAGRTSASVIDPGCNVSQCRYWIANAGGGIWRTNNVLATNPTWEYVSGSFDYNNTAALALDPNDASHDTIYAGTGEPNICRSGCIAGVGLYKSKDGGDHWSGPLGADDFSGRGIGSIVDRLRRVGRARVARDEQHLLQRHGPGREHPGRAALRALAVERRRPDVHAREPGQPDELHGQDADAGLQRRVGLFAARFG